MIAPELGVGAFQRGISVGLGFLDPFPRRTSAKVRCDRKDPSIHALSVEFKAMVERINVPIPMRFLRLVMLRGIL